MNPSPKRRLPRLSGTGEWKWIAKSSRPATAVSSTGNLSIDKRTRIANGKAIVYHWDDLVGVSNFLDISVKEVGRALHIAPATLSRRRDSDLNADESDRFYRLERIKDLAIVVLDGADKAAHWIQSEIPSLGGERPIDLVGTTKGYEDVVNVLNAIDYGVAT